MTHKHRHHWLKHMLLFFAAFGPGIVVMLADTDAGSLITAAQSGAVWGYRLLLLQFILMPILYIAQELTVRLGLTTQKGHGELIKEKFGTYWAWISVSALLLSCVGAIISEFSGLASVGILFGIPEWVMVLLAAVFLIGLVTTGSYRSVEKVAIFIGLFEFMFFVVAWKAHPNVKDIAKALVSVPWANSSYWYLMAANIGAVVMPWMIFYQQSAVVDKGLRPRHLRQARWDTAIGAVITQLIMAAALVATAATIGKTHPGASLNSVHEISQELTPFLGQTVGRLIFAMGMIGASLIAAIVVSLTAAWGLGEVTGYKRSLCNKPSQAPWFYGVYVLIVFIGAVVVLSGINLVHLNVDVEVMNAILLPVVLGFLFTLAWKVLPKKIRLQGWYWWVAMIVLSVTAAFGLISGVFGSL